MTKKLKIVFMGSPDFAVSSLKRLIDNHFDIAAVVTATDKFGGRGGKELIQSAVKRYSVDHGIPLLQPKSLKSKSFIKQLQSIKADLFVVVAFRMLPEIVWNMPRLGTVNVHGSLLPKYRGAAPINWAIINGEEESGVTTFKLTHEIDTGDILGQKRYKIKPEDDFESVYHALMTLGADLLVETLHQLTNGVVDAKIQDVAEASHAPKIFFHTCELDFNKEAIPLVNFVRGLCPYPSAHTTINGNSVKVYKAQAEIINHEKAVGSIDTDHKKYLKIACKDGYLHLLDIKVEGKKRMLIKDFLNGNKLWDEAK